MRDTYCSHCGTAFAPPLAYPRTCAQCGVEIWANPIPVSVVLLPVVAEAGEGLLVVRRGIEPRKGFLALAGGFLEAHETWQQGGARELEEEAGIAIDPAGLECFWFTSTAPRPDRVLLFSVARAVKQGDLPRFAPNHEAPERGAVFGPDGLAEVFAFPLHAEAVRRHFAARGVRGPHGFRPL